MNDELTGILQTILRKKGGRVPEIFDDNMDPIADLGLDSFDLAELAARIEDAYGVDVFEVGYPGTLGEFRKVLES